MSSSTHINYNPDVLTCLANLSNDEVFTPPQVVNQMLDSLPKHIWNDKHVKFLDPVTKTGVFLREIAKRLLIGLEEEIPNLQDRIDHIFMNQIYGIAVTELTALLSRRSVYCSKFANSEYSICSGFDEPEGNIQFDRVEHTWVNEKCVHCGASQAVYGRTSDLETYAYQFIHTTNPEDLFQMKFDVIVGNPPYQMSDGGYGDSAKPIYNLFVEQAKKLNPRYVTMIIPARWYSGGKGLDDFRNHMLRDTRIAEIHDFPETSDCFPGLNIRGGVCYFLWDKTKTSDECLVVNYKDGEVKSQIARPLLEEGAETFIRYNQAVDILRKVQAFRENTMDERVSSRKPFGLPTNFSGYTDEKTDSSTIKLFMNGKTGYVSLDKIVKNPDLVGKTKVIIAKASPGGDEYPHGVFSKPIIAGPHTACTETYLIVDTCANEEEAKNLVSYIATRFFRFLVLLIKNTQDVPKRVYRFVPVQDLSEPWTDEKLYQKYGITDEEIEFIESMVRPMEIGDLHE